MIGPLKKRLIKYLQSERSPEILYATYFKYSAAGRRKRLFEDHRQDDELMHGLSSEERAHWVERIRLVLECPDNASIPRVTQAGALVNQWLIMHNGLKIDPLSYYGPALLQMLMKNGGVHEPQEELAFQEVLKSLHVGPAKTMLELGAYWSFYSMWFLRAFPNAHCYMVEPNRENLYYGKRNFRHNNLRGTFIHAGIGDQNVPTKNITTVDAICRDKNIGFIDVLHADIQGFELDMLAGSKRMLSEQKVGYVFISTHSDDLHIACHQLLSDVYGFRTVASANLMETYSWDGVLVMKAPDYEGIEQVEISKRPTPTQKSHFVDTKEDERPVQSDDP